MSETKRDQSTKSKKETEKAKYESPAIIYEGLITTRAGSVPGPSESGDPNGIFGTG